MLESLFWMAVTGFSILGWLALLIGLTAHKTARDAARERGEID